MKRKYIMLLLVLLVGIVMVLALPWILLYIGIALSPNLAKPEITYGEFPFRLVYEINGERIVIEDSLICEFKGFGANEGTGKYRQWSKRLESGGQELILLEVDEPIGKMKSWNVTYQIIYYNPGSSWYYMGDIGDVVTYRHDFPNASYYEEYEDGSTMRGVVSADELFSRFGIVLIDWEPSEPISNDFW